MKVLPPFPTMTVHICTGVVAVLTTAKVVVCAVAIDITVPIEVAVPTTGTVAVWLTTRATKATKQKKILDFIILEPGCIAKQADRR